MNLCSRKIEMSDQSYKVASRRDAKKNQRRINSRVGGWQKTRHSSVKAWEAENFADGKLDETSRPPGDRGVQ